MPNLDTTKDLFADLVDTVARALAEDCGTGDITAELIDIETTANAAVITREKAVICGRPWVTEVFRQLDPSLTLDWLVDDGDLVAPNQLLFTVTGHARQILTGERTALNFLQTLSGTATRTRHYSDLIKHTQTRLLDTRKTLPGLRTAQKWAVSCGGCYNHRIGLYDAFLIKENHIIACDGIPKALRSTQHVDANIPIQIEVESIPQLKEALDHGAKLILLDNFTLEAMRDAVQIADGRALLEASGGITLESIVQIAETGVDRISIGALTKDIDAIDLSMRFKFDN